MGGKEKRVTGGINATTILNMSIGIPSYGMSGEASIYASLTGTRVSSGYSIDSQELILKRSPLVETLEKSLKEILSGH
jgi:hypothetical protein